MKRLTQHTWNKQTKNNRKKKGEGEEWWWGVGCWGGGKYEDSLRKQVCFVLLECSGPVSLHVKWADGASERLRAACPLLLGFALPFWRLEHRTQRRSKDTASELLKDGAESSSKEDCSFKHVGFRQKIEIFFVLRFMPFPGKTGWTYLYRSWIYDTNKCLKKWGIWQGEFYDLRGRKFHL